MLGLDWQLAGKPDATAPNKVLALERRRLGKRSMRKIKVYYQILPELRKASPLIRPIQSTS